MNEKPLERLNYFNGQRLEATDLKTEQEYHIRTLRWLNKSLYTAGIARGLEVYKLPTDPANNEPPSVSVSPGLALDNEGRAIILLEETPLEVISFAGTDATKVEGNYLVIEYGEETQGHSQGTCSSGTLEPSFIIGKPKFSWVPYIPQPGSNQVVLAQVELKSGCKEVEVIGLNQRQIVRNVSTASVRQYALEGEREVAFIPKTSFPPPEDPTHDDRVDVNVTSRIYFHIRGGIQGQSPSVVLYLKAEEFSPLHYTELGRHKHSATTTIEDHVINAREISHTHSLSPVSLSSTEPLHSISAKIQPITGTNSNLNKYAIRLFGPLPDIDPLPGWGYQQLDNEVSDGTNRIIFGGNHSHILQNIDVNGNPSSPKTDNLSEFTTLTLSHDNATTRSEVSSTGVSYDSRLGDYLRFVSDLQVFIWRIESADPPSEGDNQTEKILQQLESYYPSWRNLALGQRRLGNGGTDHIFASRGTGAIHLNFLSDKLAFSEGEYCIEFRVKKEGRTDANGGKVHYNLYIE